MGSRSQAPYRQGAFVVLVGPDGVGKTSIAREMLGMYTGCTGYVHFRPPFWSPLPSMPSSAPTAPVVKERTVGNKAVGMARLGWSLIGFWAGYVARVRPAVRRGCLVVGDRWSYGYIVQPLALGFFGPAWLARFVVSLMPKPDLLVALEAPVDVVLMRKDELTEEEVGSEMQRARSLHSPEPLVLEALGEAAAGARRILEALALSSTNRSEP